MAKRTTENLEVTAPPAPASAVPELAPVPAVAVPLIDINYPDPTSLSIVVRDVAKWSGFSFVMESSCNVKVQIFAPRKQPLHHAYELFLAALAVAGLRTVQVGNVVKIVPPSLPAAV